MTTSGILAKVRRLIQDTDSPYHWSDERLKSDLQAAVVALARDRPETRYVNGILCDPATLPTDNAAALSINGRYEDSLVYFTAYLAYADDCTDPVSKALADDFLGKYKVFSMM